MDLAELNRDCQLSGVKFTEGEGGLTFIEIANELAAARICTQGAHVVSFTPAGESPVIWMSEKTKWLPGKALRGGVPVCWPWFGPAAVAGRPSHGFARVSEWNVESVQEAAGGATIVVLSLDSEEAAFPMAEWPFRLELTVTVGSTLEIALTMTSNSEEVQEIGAALHTYFAVSDSSKIEIRGLDGVLYSDRVPGAEQVEANVQHGPVRIAGEVDRLYAPAAGVIDIVDPGMRRTIRVEKAGSLSSVVWNPWIDKSRAMADFGDEEYRTMVCVEAANAGEDQRLLLPGIRHTLTQKISVLHE